MEIGILKKITYKFFSSLKPAKTGYSKIGLYPCPETPNCVSSVDKNHYIKPLKAALTNSNPITVLAEVIANIDYAKMIKIEDKYIYAQFTTRLIGFIDDTEFYLDTNKGEIQMRSASRIGYFDFGTNRRRLELIRHLFNNKMKS